MRSAQGLLRERTSLSPSLPVLRRSLEARAVVQVEGDHGGLPSPPSVTQMSTWGSRWGRLGPEKDYFSLSVMAQSGYAPKNERKKKRVGMPRMFVE